MSPEVLVVLGARVLAGGRPSEALLARAQTAALLYHLGPSSLLVLCGGVVGHPPSEAEVALGVVTSLGVPKGACLLETSSRSTWENARECAALLLPRGLREVRVVTDAYHLFRALRCFWAHGLKATGVPSQKEGAPFVPRQRTWAVAREALALSRRPRLLLARPPP